MDEQNQLARELADAAMRLDIPRIKKAIFETLADYPPTQNERSGEVKHISLDDYIFARFFDDSKFSDGGGRCPSRSYAEIKPDYDLAIRIIKNFRPTSYTLALSFNPHGKIDYEMRLRDVEGLDGLYEELKSYTEKCCVSHPVDTWRD